MPRALTIRCNDQKQCSGSFNFVLTSNIGCNKQNENGKVARDSSFAWGLGTLLCKSKAMYREHKTKTTPKFKMPAPSVEMPVPKVKMADPKGEMTVPKVKMAGPEVNKLKWKP